MANLIEIPQWEAAIYQLETEDPVLGGPDGIDNWQAKALGNRTQYLKQEIESAQGDMDAHLAAADPHPQYLTEPEGNALIAAAVAALVNSSPATLDTLAEFANALGNDPNFATTLTNLLALKAPLASPALTGTPTGPTQAQFDASTKLATMEAVQRALGNLRGRVDLNDSAALDASHVGKEVRATTSGITITLPLAASLPDGTMIVMSHPNANGNFYVQRQGAEAIAWNGNSVNSLTVSGGETLIVVSRSTGAWGVIDGTFAAMRGSLRGYQVYTTSTVLTDVDVGKEIGISGTVTVTLPTAAGVTAGSSIRLFSSGGIATIQRNGAETIVPMSGAGITSFTMTAGDDAVLMATGGGSWLIIGGSVALRNSSGDFGKSLAANGWQKLPGGLILQWGQNLNVSSTQGAVTVTLPFAFPNACLNASATLRNSTSSGAMEWGTQVVSFNQTQLVLFNQIYPNSSGSTFDGYYWFAIGH